MLGLYLGLIALYIWFWLFMVPKTPIVAAVLFPALLIFWTPLKVLQYLCQSIDRAVYDVGSFIYWAAVELESMESEWSDFE